MGELINHIPREENMVKEPRNEMPIENILNEEQKKTN
jgi:hypothetical protein